MTNHIHRLLFIAPVARLTAAFRTFWQNQLDANDNPSTWPGLNATGNVADPVQARWCCGAFTTPFCKRVLDRWYATASMTPPDWTTLSRAQIRSRLATDRAALVAGSGIRVFHADNDGAWDNAQAALTAAGLKVITPAMGG